MRFAKEASSLDGALRFAREVGLPDLPPFHELADTFDSWHEAPGWQRPQKQAWSELTGAESGWGLLKLKLAARQMHLADLRQAPVMVSGELLLLLARLQRALNALAAAMAPHITPGLVTDVFQSARSRRPAELIAAGVAGEAALRDACDCVVRASVAMLPWAEPHWAAVVGPGRQLRLCLLPAPLATAFSILAHDVYPLGPLGGSVDTRDGVWRWLREQDRRRLIQGGPLAPPYAGTITEWDRSAGAGEWPDGTRLVDLILRFGLSAAQVAQSRRSPSEAPYRSYLIHALYLLTHLSAWDNPDMAVPTAKPYASLRHAMAGMASRDAFGGWWVRCHDLERCGKLLFAPSEGRWYHRELGCGSGRRAREAKRRARAKV